MPNKNDGGPAFPIEGNHHGEVEWHHGMSLRDWFAGTATDDAISRASVEYMEKKDTGRCTVSQARYYYADAMIKEREK